MVKEPSLLFKISRGFLNWFGNIKIYSHFPFFILGYKGYKVKGVESRVIMDKVQTGDVLLRNYDGFLSSKLITMLSGGRWSHAALVVSNDTIIHATSKGVNEEDILDFLRCDHVMVLRIPATATQRTEWVQKAIDSLGLEYDYLFDSESTDRFSCSEAVAYYLKDNGIISITPKRKGFSKGQVTPSCFEWFGMDVIHDSKEYRTKDSM